MNVIVLRMQESVSEALWIKGFIGDNGMYSTLFLEKSTGIWINYVLSISSSPFFLCPLLPPSLTLEYTFGECQVGEQQC